jgi:hypothetical protein
MKTCVTNLHTECDAWVCEVYEPCGKPAVGEIDNGYKKGSSPFCEAHRPTCDHCGDPIEAEGFAVKCDTCKKPQRLREHCWNNADDCVECEDRAEAFGLAMSHDNNTCPCRCGHARTCRDCGFYGAEGKEQ